MAKEKNINDNTLVQTEKPDYESEIIRVIKGLEEMIVEKLHIEQYTISQYTPSLYDKIAGFLTNPALQALMVTLIIGGIFFELKTPGFGLPSAIALCAAALYFLPLFIGGTAESWEILIFFVGIILLIFELFVIPGFKKL